MNIEVQIAKAGGLTWKVIPKTVSNDYSAFDLGRDELLDIIERNGSAYFYKESKPSGQNSLALN